MGHGLEPIGGLLLMRIALQQQRLAAALLGEARSPRIRTGCKPDFRNAARCVCIRAELLAVTAISDTSRHMKHHGRHQCDMQPTQCPSCRILSGILRLDEPDSGGGHRGTIASLRTTSRPKWEGDPGCAPGHGDGALWAGPSCLGGPSPVRQSLAEEGRLEVRELGRWLPATLPQ